MKSIIVNVQIQFDSFDEGEDRELALNGLHRINSLLQEQMGDICPQIFVNAIDNSDIEVSKYDDEDDENITYEMIGYMTSSDYDGRNGTDLGGGYGTMEEARGIAKDLLEEYVIVKIQSNDREEIEILGEIPNDNICGACGGDAGICDGC
ncbi:MAG: hypothetical protein GTO02_19500 [Candidatus Dadabacteria bacterium]|nr:hypothetical protein [Candidatus Dadabacteria bacterium]